MKALLRHVRIGKSKTRWLVAAVAGIVFVYGIMWQNVGLLGGGAAVLCLTLWTASGTAEGRQRPARYGPVGSSRRRRVADAGENAGNDSETSGATPASTLSARLLGQPSSAPAQNVDALVDELLQAGRYALLLRKETSGHLTRKHILSAVRMLDDAMALVPAGKVLIGQWAERAALSANSEMDPALAARGRVHVEALYLDRYAVTNREYQQFVDSGGYEQLEYWPEEALPALLDFVDQTGAPGPKFWADGTYPRELEDHPVVGVSWYEAFAYARWCGKRLPTDAEWSKAGAWPIESAPGRIAQRRFPWGEAFDIRRANLWGTGNQSTVPVDDFPNGGSVGGVQQLIGNVWEWTSTPLSESALPSLHVAETMRSIRGGAFDTYFENQATCHYQSGSSPLARRPNIGFRLALSMSVLDASAPEAEAPPAAAASPEAANQHASPAKSEAAVGQAGQSAATKQEANNPKEKPRAVPVEAAAPPAEVTTSH